MKINLLFEQSGTFKNVLREMMNNALDIDISNAYNETQITRTVEKLKDKNGYALAGRRDNP